MLCSLSPALNTKLSARTTEKLVIFGIVLEHATDHQAIDEEIGVNKQCVGSEEIPHVT